MNPTLRTHTLPNGLRLLFEPTTSAVAYCGYAIDAGTRDEPDDRAGLAHFVEHLLFKGTQRRRAWHILNRMENVGGELNAYTNKEETMVYSIFPRPHLSRAMELLTDIVFRSTFPAREMEREREVIADEIRSYEDEPSELIFDEFEALLFGSHPLGRNILGSPAVLRRLTTADALAYTAQHYLPSNMVLFVRANIDFGRLLHMAGHLTAELATGTVEQRRTAPTDYLPTRCVQHRNTHQAHVMIGTRTFGFHDSRRTALGLLNNLLGGPGMNSRLNVALRERRGLVYNVESNLTTYTDAGVFSIYFGCDVDDVDDCVGYVDVELERLRRDRLSPTRLSMAKKQLIGQISVAADHHENHVLSLAKSYLHYHRHEPTAELCRRIEAVTADDLLTVAHEWLSPERLSMLVYK